MLDMAMTFNHKQAVKVVVNIINTVLLSRGHTQKGDLHVHSSYGMVDVE